MLAVPVILEDSLSEPWVQVTTSTADQGSKRGTFCCFQVQGWVCLYARANDHTRALGFPPKPIFILFGVYCIGLRHDHGFLTSEPS